MYLKSGEPAPTTGNQSQSQSIRVNPRGNVWLAVFLSECKKTDLKCPAKDRKIHSPGKERFYVRVQIDAIQSEQTALR